MEAEQIVRTLAELDPPYGEPEALSAWELTHGYTQENRCLLCEADHAADCPWRLAREWVAAQDGTNAPSR